MTGMDIYKNLQKSAKLNIEKKRNGRIRAVLGYSRDSIGIGANGILAALQDVLEERKIEDVTIETTGPSSACYREPLLNIYTKDGERYTYEMVTPEKARTIIIAHAMYDECVKGWIVEK